MSNVRIDLYWRDGGDVTAGLPSKLHETLQALGKLHPDLEKWRWLDLKGKAKDVDGMRSCADALEATRQPWQVGNATRYAFGPRFVLPSFGTPPAELSGVVGIGLMPPKLPTWVPSRLQLVLRAEKLTDRPTIEASLRGLVSIWSPDWALVSVGGVPIPPSPPMDDGTPVIGWMTYLSNRYPDVPQLPIPAVAYPLEGGTLIVARPEFDPALGEHVASLHQVRAALAQGGVLFPAYMLPSPRAD